jgi:hypothetical protein
MTKLSLAKYLKQIQGTLSKTLITFRTWKERQVLEDYPKPTYTRTSKQDLQRTHFRYCCDQWKQLTDEQKEAYKEKAGKLGLTAFNVFISECLKKPMITTKYKVTIDNTQLNVTLTDYQIKLVVNNDATFFSDFDNDHKFMEVYDSDQTTQIPFWVEKWDTTNKNAVIWIKVPTIQASSKKDIYLMYNPPRTTYLSNKANVLDFYDDFDVDLSKWNILGGTWTLENGMLKTPTGVSGAVTSKNFSSLNVKVRSRLALQQSISDNSISIIVRVTASNTFYQFEYDGKNNQLVLNKCVNGTWASIASISNPANLNFHELEARIYGSRLELWFDGVQKIVATDTSITSSAPIGCRKGYISYYGYFDYVYVTKYAYPEPTVTYTKL